MDDQIIVAVSLCGSSEDRQPDPIVLRTEDESWPHFSTLMMSLYKPPPSAVIIKYLDDEKDWIDMSSEAELSEALRMIKLSGEILQVRVLPVSDDGWQDHAYIKDRTQTTPVSSEDPFKWIPTTDGRYASGKDDGWQDHTDIKDSSLSSPVPDQGSYKCHGTTGARYTHEEPLVYPHSTAPTAPTAQGVMVTSVGGTQYIDAPATQPWLVYPHPNTQPQPTQHQSLVSECTGAQAQVADPVVVSQCSGDSNSSSGDMTKVANTNRPAAVSRTSAPATGNKTTLLAAATAWQDASKLPPQEKVKFLKRLVSGNDAGFKTAENKTGKTQVLRAASSDATKCHDNPPSVDSLLKEFAGEPKVTQPMKGVWEGQNVQLTPQGQDPFEVDSVNVLDQTQLVSEMDNSPTLTPTKISKPLEENRVGNSTQRETEPPAFKFAGLSPLTLVQAWPDQHKIVTSSQGLTTITMTCESSEPPTVVRTENSHGLTNNNPKQPRKDGSKTRAAHEAVSTAVTKIAKVPVKPPVPLPRALLMMEGAPCGANAVAIEMPAEAESVKSEPEGEEVAASGGAACVAASEETGEILAREGDAAAVSSQIKQVKERECGAGAVVSWETSPVLQVEVQAHKHRKDKSPEKKKKGKDVKSEKKSNKKSDGDAKKEDKDKKKEDKKKKEEEKEKKKQSKEENRVKLSEDVESGEKVRVKGDAALQYNDFVKHMKKLKKDMQASIVRDVTQEMYRIVQTGLFSLSQAQFNSSQKENFSEGVEHMGIYCDNCNCRIIGIRYKCGNCFDFDLCERCEALPNLHDPTHVFLKLRQPARNAGCAPSGGAGEKYCLLKENIYLVERAKQGDPGTPVDLSLHSGGEEQGSNFDTSKKENSPLADVSQRNITNKNKEDCEREKRDYQEYQEHLAGFSREFASRDRHQDGHFGGCSETLNSSSFDLTMARGIDSGMSKIGQEAEERLVAHTGLLPSAPLRQRYRDQDKSSECHSLSSCSGGSSIVHLPTPPDSSIVTVPSLEACVAQRMAQPAEAREPESLCLVLDGGHDIPSHQLQEPQETVQAATASVTHSDPTPLNLTKAPYPLSEGALVESTLLLSLMASEPRTMPMIPLVASSLHKITPMVPLEASSLPKSTPIVPLEASSLPKSAPMVSLEASSFPKSAPMVPLEASSLPKSTPIVPLEASSLPKSAPMVPLEASSLPKSAPMVPLEASSLPKSAPMVPLEASSLPKYSQVVPLTPATPSHSASLQTYHSVPIVASMTSTLAVVEDNDESAPEIDEDKQTSARDRQDSGSDDFVFENCTSSSDDDEDEEDFDENENRNRNLGAVWDSDSSDDFCIIDPENAALIPEGFELLPDSRSLTAALTQSQTVTCDSDVPLPNSCPAPSYEEVMSSSQMSCTQGSLVISDLRDEGEAQKLVEVVELAADVQEVTLVNPVSVEPTPEAAVIASKDTDLVNEEVESAPIVETMSAMAISDPVKSDQDVKTCATSADTAACCDDNTDETRPVLSGLIHKMSADEKSRFLELLKMEMDREYILEARRAEAEFRNRELELISLHAEMKPKPAEEVHSSSTASLAGSARSLSWSTSEASSIGVAAAPVAGERVEKFSRSSSVASSTRDADCQTVSTCLGQDQPSASHIIHNVATGVSKAATTAFLTAKDVFHSLQAKQSDWKAPSSSYKPPQSQWKPPADTYKPPKNTYKLPENTYQPPEDTYRPPESTYKPPEDTYKPPRDYDDYSNCIPPSSNWTLPRSIFVPPNIEWVVSDDRAEASHRNEGQISETQAGSVIIPNDESGVQEVTSGTLATAPTESSSVDEALELDRLQREGMKRLVEMGFANREENRRLLAEFKGDLMDVVQALVDGQSNDQWAHNRH